MTFEHIRNSILLMDEEVLYPEKLTVFHIALIIAHTVCPLDYCKFDITICVYVYMCVCVYVCVYYACYMTFEHIWDSILLMDEVVLNPEKLTVCTDVSQWCYIGAAVVLHWCCDSATEVLE
jgi:hypothetical protein